MNADRIEKKILLRATPERVWRALTDPDEFRSWFGVQVEGPFQPGAHVRGAIVGTLVDAKIAEMQRQHGGTPFEFTIERMERPRLFSFRWHPHAVEAGVDYSREPTTLIVFTIEETAEGVMLTVTESGFEGIPLERRAKAFESNEGGWAIMLGIIGKYLAKEG